MNYHIKYLCRARKTPALFASLCFCLALFRSPTHAAEPVFETLAKTLAPITAAILGGSPNQQLGALVAEGTIQNASGKLAPAQNARLRLAIQAPDNLRADLVYNDTLLTACRKGDEMWATPAPLMRSLAKSAGIDPEKSKPDTNTKSPPIVPLAFDPQLLVFLPAIFDVKDLGYENIEEKPHRVLQLALLKELRKAANAEDFTARAWIAPDYKLRRLIIAGSDYSIEIALDKLNFANRLAPIAWEAPKDKDVLRLPASAMSEMFEKMLGTKIPVTPQ